MARVLISMPEKFLDEIEKLRQKAFPQYYKYKQGRKPYQDSVPVSPDGGG